MGTPELVMSPQRSAAAVLEEQIGELAGHIAAATCRLLLFDRRVR
jgi:hypothetical protein